jgi:hypothetical protein
MRRPGSQRPAAGYDRPTLRRNLGLLLLLVLTAAAYRPLNMRPSARVLRIGADDAIPLVPLATIPYLVFLPVYWGTVVVAGVRGDRLFPRLALAGVVAYATSNVVYLAFQTHMPRPPVPDELGASLLRFVYEQDRPYCDFPSEHAASAILFALYVNAARRPLRRPATVLAVAVLPATLMTKQHTVAGMVGGALVAALSWGLVARLRRDQLKPE